MAVLVIVVTRLSKEVLLGDSVVVVTIVVVVVEVVLSLVCCSAVGLPHPLSKNRIATHKQIICLRIEESSNQRDRENRSAK